MKTLNYKTLVLLYIFITSSISVFSQKKIEILTKNYIEQTSEEYNLSKDDIKEWIITSNHISKKSGIHHVYGLQKHNGIEIYNATFNLHIVDDNKVVSYKNNFVNNITIKVKNNNTTTNITPIEAIESAAKQLNLPLNNRIKYIESEQLYEAKEISSTLIPAKLMYYLNSSNDLILVWDISINEIKGQNWWSLKIDASTGIILDKVNWVDSCTFGEHEHSKNKKIKSTKKNSKPTTNSFVGGYNVYPFPIESPNHGSRIIVTDPDDATASPFGWHDTNGITGAEFTITRGNNSYAYENGDNSGFSPDGGSGLNFDFPININYSSSNQSEAAAITNLFYWNNICHDIWYQYGFDEVSGNFQENNYGNGASGSDSVSAESQKGLLCNAFFSTPPDGQNPTMQMYVGNCGPLTKDGSIDNLVIVHEFGHGISKRLVGGRTNTSVLLNQEQMGEGWSDWFGLIMTTQSNDSETDLRPVGTWLFGQSANGPGIRNWPYSTDIVASQYTYDDIKTLSVPHGVGSVWASMLWEVTWELINAHGYDSDLYNGTGGNNIAMQLVIEALKMTPNSPGFVDGRDAILQADQALYNGENQCYIWTAFAKRGLGVSANQGSPNSRTDGTEAFDVPVCNNCSLNPPTTLTTSNITYNSVNLSWTNISGNNGYQIQYKETTATSWDNSINISINATSYILNGLQDVTTYQWRIRTKCSNGEYGIWSSISSFTTPEECVENITKFNTINSGTEYIETSNNITSYSKITGKANVTYSAGNSILLKATGEPFNLSFHVKPGHTASRFLAKIEGCDNTTQKVIHENKNYNSVVKQYNNDTIKYDFINNNEVVELENKETIKLYPNPTNNILNVISKENISNWELTNQLGRVLKKQPVNNKKTTQFNIQNLPTGLYFVKITLSNGEQIIKRAIKN